METRYRGDVVYCPEDDVHFPSLTVQETLSFASKMRAPHNRIDQSTRAQYMDVQTDVLMTVFGLTHARHSASCLSFYSCVVLTVCYQLWWATSLYAEFQEERRNAYPLLKTLQAGVALVHGISEQPIDWSHLPD